MKYMVVKGRTQDELEEAVRDMLTDGWRPVGGVAVQLFEDIDQPDLWCQAMILEEK